MRYAPPEYCRVFFTRQKLTPGQLIQPRRNRFFRVLEKALPCVWIVQPYRPWSTR